MKTIQFLIGAFFALAIPTLGIFFYYGEYRSDRGFADGVNVARESWEGMVRACFEGRQSCLYTSDDGRRFNIRFSPFEAGEYETKPSFDEKG